MPNLRIAVARRTGPILLSLGILAAVLGGGKTASAENVINWGIWRNAARTQINVTLTTDQTPPIGTWTNTCVGGPATILFNNPGTPAGGVINYQTLWGVNPPSTYTVTIYRNGAPIFSATG